MLNFSPITSSSSSSLFTFLLLQCLLLPTIKTEQCIDVSNPKTCTFKSLIDLQTNNRSFFPEDANFDGNYVAFSASKIETLPKNSFVTFGSKYIEKLSLDNHGISTIEDGAFISLACLMYLELQKNEIDSISKETFQRLTKLHELNLEDNRIVEIPERTFTFLVRLRKLNMCRNKLKVLNAESFYGLAFLEELDLSHNYLNDLIPDTFQYFGHLTSLQLGTNQIEYIEFDKFKNLSSLKILNLSNNALECFDTTYRYSFSDNLTELYLNGNSIMKMDPDGFKKSLPALKTIDIEDNLWLCDDLSAVINVLNSSQISYRSLNIGKPNVNGIACNRTLEIQKRKTPHRETTTEFVTTTTIPPSLKESQSNLVNVTDVLDSIKRTQTVMICLLVAIVIFIVADVAVRCGCLNSWLNRRRHSFFDNVETDDNSLLRY